MAGAQSEVYEELAAELSRAIAGEVRFDQMTRLLYSTDASNYQIEPIGVVFPRDADEVCAVHEIAARLKVPLLPRGAGSSLAGQTVGHALVLDCSRHMNRLLSINGETRRVRVQPGVVLGQLNRQLAPLRLMVGPDPASAERATIGGCLGNNATGMHSILYGMFGDHVQTVDAVLANGKRVSLGATVSLTPEVTRLQEQIGAIVRTYQEDIRTGYPRTWRTVAGYALNKLNPDSPDLAQLFAGAEGTLGTVVAIELGLVERPSRTCQVVLHFGDLHAALRSFQRFWKWGRPPSN
jgi:FAD/FMN-containing dehydrogenase